MSKSRNNAHTGVEAFTKFKFPLIRKRYPNLVAQDLIYTSSPGDPPFEEGDLIVRTFQDGTMRACKVSAVSACRISPSPRSGKKPGWRWRIKAKVLGARKGHWTWADLWRRASPLELLAAQAGSDDH